MKQEKTFLNRESGFALFIAMVIMSTMLLISAGIVNLAVKQSFISAAARDSQYAFHVADTGVECALYWDTKNPGGLSAFDTTTTASIHCNRDANNPGNTFTVGGNAPSTFTISFLPDPYCAQVVVTKLGDGSTLVESYGYNTCNTANPRRVERAVRARY
jgi:Tfp pilus assembly protein PilX